MSRRGENIYKRKDGRWEGRFIVSRDLSGKARYKSIYGTCYKDIKAKLEVAKQSSLSYTTAHYYEYKLSILCNEWLMEHQKDITESSYVKYYNIISLNIIPYLGEIKLKNITLQTIHCYIQELLSHGSRKGNGLSIKSVCDIISVFKNIKPYIEYHNGHVHIYINQNTLKQHK